MPKADLGKGDLLRIMMYGPQGAGKTYAWLKLVEKCAKLIISGKYTVEGVPRFHVLDPDAGVQETLNDFKSDVKDVMVKLIDYYNVVDWDDLKKCFNEIKKNVKQGDFVVIEQLGQIWDMAQSHYIKEVFKDDMGDYFLFIRQKLVDMKKKGMEAQAKLDGWTDWPVVKRMHNTDFIEVALKRLGVKVITTSSMKEIYDNQYEDKEVAEMFAGIRRKPEGEKHNVHRVDVILLLGRDKDKNYWVRTATKIRGMPEFIEKILPGQGALDVYFRKRTEALGKTMEVQPPSQPQPQSVPQAPAQPAPQPVESRPPNNVQEELKKAQEEKKEEKKEEAPANPDVLF